MLFKGRCQSRAADFFNFERVNMSQERYQIIADLHHEPSLSDEERLAVASIVKEHREALAALEALRSDSPKALVTKESVDDLIARMRGEK